VVCTATYTVSQDDVDSGFVTNSASASALNSVGATVQSAGPPASVTVDANSFTASLSLAKSSTSTSFTAAGQMIPYTYVVTNTGTISLTEVFVTDATTPGATTINVTCPDTLENLAPEQSETCTASPEYTTTAADVTAGSVTNDATASAFDVLNFNQWNSAEESVTVPLT